MGRFNTLQKYRETVAIVATRTFGGDQQYIGLAGTFLLRLLHVALLLALWRSVLAGRGPVSGMTLDVIFAGCMVFLEHSVYGLQLIRDAVSVLLSGALIPLALMPWGLGDRLQWLPFASLASASLRIPAPATCSSWCPCRGGGVWSCGLRPTPCGAATASGWSLMAVELTDALRAADASLRTPWPVQLVRRWRVQAYLDFVFMTRDSRFFLIDVLAAPSPPEEDWRAVAPVGGLQVPALELLDADDRALWFSGYVQTYLERDLQALRAVENLPDFRRLMRAACLRIGGLLNQSDLGRDVGISQPQVHRFLNLMEATYQLVRLPAYAVNRTMRLIKAPKLYWSDTGLAMFLAGESQPRGGHLENLVLTELLVWRDLQARRPEVLYWRTATGLEVDFVIETPARLLPLEVKGGPGDAGRRQRCDSLPAGVPGPGRWRPAALRRPRRLPAHAAGACRALVVSLLRFTARRADCPPGPLLPAPARSPGHAQGRDRHRAQAGAHHLPPDHPAGQIRRRVPLLASNGRRWRPFGLRRLASQHQPTIYSMLHEGERTG